MSRIQPLKIAKANRNTKIISMQNLQRDQSLDSALPRGRKSDRAYKVLKFQTSTGAELNYFNFDQTQMARMQAPVPKSKNLVGPILLKKPAPSIPQIQDVYMKSE
jgi:hypothetical protein